MPPSSLSPTLTYLFHNWFAQLSATFFTFLPPTDLNLKLLKDNGDRKERGEKECTDMILMVS
jgi:hypothetical protein